MTTQPPSRRTRYRLLARLTVPLWVLLLGAVGALLALAPASAAPAHLPLPRPAGWPMAGAPPVLRGFDPPTEVYGAGHRGVDLGGLVGQPVLAAAAGTVSFAGRAGSLDAVSVDHGGVRTTYSPVSAGVRVGTWVNLGQQIGTLEPGHCPDLGGRQACLHWGLLSGAEYLDPLQLIRDGTVTEFRLVSADERAAVLTRQRLAATVPPDYPVGSAFTAGGGWSSVGARAAVAFAFAQLGKPYVFGAAGPNTFDCSGLTMRAWEAGGVEIGHYTGTQWQHVQHISSSELRPGDLVFWGTTADPSSIYHTAIYIGGDRIIQAPRPGKTVEISGLHDWISPNFFGRAPAHR